MRQLNKKGFTIIELLIATVVFAVILLVITGAVVQFSRLYYKGVVTSRTQQTARNIIEDISGSIQYSGGSSFEPHFPNYAAPPILSGSDGYFCIGSKRYSFVLGRQLNTTQRHVLVRDDDPDCAASYPSLATPALDPDASELIGENMQLLYVNVEDNIGGNANLYKITVRVAYGQESDMSDTTTLLGAPGTDGIMDICQPTGIGGEFCSISELSTVVAKRTGSE